MPNRRQFLGAAAALWNLPFDDQLNLYTDVSEFEEVDAREYPREVTYEGFDGSLVAEDYADVDVAIEVYPHQPEIPVVLGLRMGGIEVGAAMEPGEARAVGRSLVGAAREVEVWRRRRATD